MKIAVDTNILAYAEGLGDELRCTSSRQMLRQIESHRLFLPSQTLGELFAVLVRKAKRPAEEARSAVLSWMDSFAVINSNADAITSAMDLVIDHQLQMWDALIMATAADNHCRLLLSEDLQDGFTWRGVTVLNPFSNAQRHPLW